MGYADWIVNFIDLIWLPIAALVVHKHQRLWAFFFVILCAVSMRLQIELVYSTGSTNGFIPFLFDSDVKLRATLIYGVFCALFLLLMAASPRSPWSVLLSASIGVYFLAFVVSMIVMVV
jgi:hypothetical protein